MKLILSTVLFTLTMALAAEDEPPNRRHLEGVVTFNGAGCVDYDSSDNAWQEESFSVDTTVQDVPLQFPFTFGGVTRPSIDISSNGHLVFDTTSTGGRDSTSGNFVDSSEAVIAPFWSDIDVTANGHILHRHVGTDKFVVIWRDVASYSVSSDVINTFQVVLSSDDSNDPQISFCYDTMGWSESGDAGISTGSGSGFLLGTFSQEDDSWNGLGSSGNGVGHLEGHSYSFDDNIVDSATPDCSITSTNDATVQCETEGSTDGPTSGPTSGPTAGPTSGPTSEATTPQPLHDPIAFNGPGCIDYDPSDRSWQNKEFTFGIDNIILDVPLGFDFTYGGRTRTNVDIHSDGLILFGSHPGGVTSLFDGDFVGAGEPAIAPFWADIDTDVHGNIRYKQVGADKFAVVWHEISRNFVDSTNIFQVVISSDVSGDPKICFCYDTMGWSSHADIGISIGPDSGFLLGAFNRGDDRWNGIGSNGNGRGHLDGHSYCFDPSIVNSATPECDIATNDETIQCQREAGPGGDPHFTTWNNEHFEYHGQCDLTLVKDADFAQGLGLDIQIRTKVVRFWSYIKTVAIKIGHDILEIEGSADEDDAEAHYWINFENQGELDTFAGFPAIQKLPSTYKRQYIIDLSSKYPGASIVIQLYKEFVRVKFNGDASIFGETVGLLGDYQTGKLLARDGSTVLDNFSEFGDEWQVLPSEPKLFREVAHPQFPELCIKPEDPRGERKRRLAESKISIEEAETACGALKDPLTMKDCVYDVLATQDLGMVGAF